MFLYLKITLCVVFGVLSVSHAMTRDDAVGVALENNPKVIVAHQAWKAERARSLQTWSLPDPEFELEYEGMSGAFRFGTFEQRDWGLVQRFPFPVAWWLHGQGSGLRAQAVQLGVYEKTRADVALQVHKAYDRVLADAQIVRYAKTHVTLAEQLFQRAERRFLAGDVPKLDVMRAEVALLRQKNQYMIAQSKLKVARVALRTLLNQPNDRVLKLADSLVYASEDLDGDVLREKALRNRSDYLGVQQAYLSAQKERSAMVASWLPDVSVGIFRQKAVTPTGFQKSWRSGIAVELPVWALLRQRGQMGESQAQVAQAVAERDLVKLEIEQEVATAVANVQAVAERVKWMKERILPTSEAAFDMARRSYDEGKASYLALLEAQREWVDTQAEFVETLYDYRVAKAQLAHATGTLLVSQENE